MPSGFRTVPNPDNASTSHSSGSQLIHGASVLAHPGIAPSMLGKRHRDSTSSVTGIIDEGQEGEFTEEEMATKLVRPSTKRVKLNEDDGTLLGETTSSKSDPSEEEVPAAPRVPSFTVFSGPEEPPEQYVDPPPPTIRLPDYFTPPSPSDAGPSDATRQQIATINATENQHPFGFNFLPDSSTPGHSMFMPSFPYPEAPQSPSPAGPQSVGNFPGSYQGERTDIYQTFGLPPPHRSRSGASSSQDPMGGMSAFVNPAALSRRSSSREKEREVSSNDVAAGLGLKAVKTSSEPEAGSSNDVPPSKRTMYGTELEGDTRFGDFGVEGVATGFWAGGRY